MDATGIEERVARLEERMASVHGLLTEIREQQRDMSEIVARASGGFRVLLLMGGLAGAFGALRGIAGWVDKLH
jgi:hypothetical protein